MRHQNKGFKLGRTHSHRKATLASLSSALIAHKRITTTLAKARALRMHVEPIINRAKEDSTHSRRQAFRSLRSKHAVKELFSDVAEKIGDRPGGYTRIVKLGQRAGDSAEMAIIELVDYNDVRPDGAASKSKTRRTRRSRSRSKSGGAKAAATATAAKAKDEADEVVEEVQDAVAEVEAAADDAVETATDAVDEATDTGADDEEKKEDA